MNLRTNISKRKALTKYELNKKERIEIIASNLNLTNEILSVKTGLNIRTVQRYKKLIRDQKSAKLEVSHGNKEKEKNKRLSDSVITDIYVDYLKISNTIIVTDKTTNQISISEYYNSFLSNEHKNKISYAHLVERFNKLGFKTIHTTKRGRKIQREAKKSVDKKVYLLLNNIESQIQKNRISRQVLHLSKNLKFGEIVEIDAQFEPYINGEKVYLYHAIDVATGMLLAVWFENEETNLGYQRLLEILFKNYGFPKFIYTDKRRTFWGSDNTETAFEKNLNAKGIRIISSSNPKHKPHVERSFRTALDKYPTYIYKNGLQTLSDLKEHSEGFKNYYNQRLKRILNKESLFNLEGTKRENWRVDIEVNRKILNGVVRYGGINYAAFDEEGKRIIFPLHSNVRLVHSSDGNIYFKYLDKKYYAKEPTGVYLTETELWALSKGLDISIPAVEKLELLYKRSKSFFDTIKKYIDKMNDLLSKFNQDNEEIKKTMLELFGSLKTLSSKVKSDIYIE
ncbi:transposase family protein [Mycoplasma sp. VS276A1]